MSKESSVELGRKFLDELKRIGAEVPSELIQVQEMLEACDKNATQVASNISEARRRRTGNTDGMKGNEALLKEQSALLDQITTLYEKLSKRDDWIQQKVNN